MSQDEARRLVLTAQGFGSPPYARITLTTLRGLLQRLGAIQIDSINVVARSHELVLAARTGVGSADLFSKAVYQQRVGFEYWGHAASFLPIEAYRLFRPRMALYASGKGRAWFAKAREAYVDLYKAVLERIRHEGPLPASAFRDAAAPKRGTWWDWTPAKVALEDLHAQGVLLVHDRVRFERRYDLSERVLPQGLDLTPPSAAEAAAQLILLASKSLGVGTAADLQDYFRLPGKEARSAIAELTSSGRLEAISVDGWQDPAFVLPGVSIPRKVEFPPTLIGPFDSLIWATGGAKPDAQESGARERTRRVFGMNYKLEVYVPPAQRLHGYYTMPVLAQGQLVARVDPKLDSKVGRLLLRAVHVEPGVDLEMACEAVVEASMRLARALGAQAVALDGAPIAVSTADELTSFAVLIKSALSRHPDVKDRPTS